MHIISACYKTQARDNTSAWTAAQTSLVLMPNLILHLVYPWVLSVFLELVKNKAALWIIDTGPMGSKTFR